MTAGADTRLAQYPADWSAANERGRRFSGRPADLPIQRSRLGVQRSRRAQSYPASRIFGGKELAQGSLLTAGVSAQRHAREGMSDHGARIEQRFQPSRWAFEE